LGNLVKTDAESGDFCTLIYALWHLGVRRSPCHQPGSLSVIPLIQNSTICVCHTDSHHHAYDSLLTANQAAKKNILSDTKQLCLGCVWLITDWLFKNNSMCFDFRSVLKTLHMIALFPPLTIPLKTRISHIIQWINNL